MLLRGVGMTFETPELGLDRVNRRGDGEVVGAGHNELGDRNVARAEGGLAVGEIVAPFAEENLVEPKRADGFELFLEGLAPALERERVVRCHVLAVNKIQVAAGVEGLGDACMELEIPVTGGNVSFYNQTGDQPIHPTPVVGVLGIIDDVERRVPSAWQDEGNNIYLLGVTRSELDGSAWAGTIHHHLGGLPPQLSLDDEKALAHLVQGAALEGLLMSAHDLSEGGLAQALADSVARFGIGARVWLNDIIERDGMDVTSALFSESTARAIVTVPREDDVKFVGLCEARGYPVLRIGVTDGHGADAALQVQDVFTVPVAEIRERSNATLPHYFA